jgi:hypothetical protein
VSLLDLWPFGVKMGRLPTERPSLRQAARHELNVILRRAQIDCLRPTNPAASVSADVVLIADTGTHCQPTGVEDSAQETEVLGAVDAGPAAHSLGDDVAVRKRLRNTLTAAEPIGRTPSKCWLCKRAGALLLEELNALSLSVETLDRVDCRESAPMRPILIPDQRLIQTPFAQLHTRAPLPPCLS